MDRLDDAGNSLLTEPINIATMCDAIEEMTNFAALTKLESRIFGLEELIASDERQETGDILHELIIQRNNLGLLKRLHTLVSERATAKSQRDNTGGGESLLRSVANNINTWTCHICDDKSADATDFALLPCGHEYCRDCVNHRIRSAMTDGSLFPPSCCTREIEIDDAVIKSQLDDALCKEVSSRYVELSTSPKLGTHCYEPTCGAFIDPARAIYEGGNDLACAVCSKRTCATCKRAGHRGVDCSEDPETRQFLDFAKTQRFQRCFSCKRVVERVAGCSHILCTCGAEFCYDCGREYRNCQCREGRGMRFLPRYARRNAGVPNPERQPGRMYLHAGVDADAPPALGFADDDEEYEDEEDDDDEDADRPVQGAPRVFDVAVEVFNDEVPEERVRAGGDGVRGNNTNAANATREYGNEGNRVANEYARYPGQDQDELGYGAGHHDGFQAGLDGGVNADVAYQRAYQRAQDISLGLHFEQGWKEGFDEGRHEGFAIDRSAPRSG